MITELADLEAFCDHARAEGSLALDTEFARERRYNAQLQLVQVATRRESSLVDPLVLGDLTPLWEVVADPAVEVLLHDAAQDLEIFYRMSGLKPRNIVDTQVAAAMIGLGEQPGYASVAQQLLGVQLQKQERVTDWSRRPLTQRQADYALDDVRYLHPMRDKLVDELRRLGRYGWFELELVDVEDMRRFEPDPAMVWTRVSGAGGLEGVGLAVLRELAAWREAEAARADIPRKHVLADDIMIDICRRMPTSLDDLSELRRLTRGTLQRHADALLECVERGRRCPRGSWPRRPRKVRLTEDYGPLLDLLMVYVRHRARELSIAQNYLATADDLRTFVGHALEEDPVEAPKVLKGWRRRFIGEEMLELVSGRLSLGFVRETNSLSLHEDAP